MNSDDNSPSIEERLRAAWQRERRYVHTRGACRLFIWLITVLAVDFIIDWKMYSHSRVGGELGLLLLVINLGILGWALWWEWLRHLEDYDPVKVALDVEARHTGLASLLVSYTQIDVEVAGESEVSTELIHAMREQTLEVSQPLDFRSIVDFGQLKQLFLVSAGVLLLFAGLSVRWGEHVGVLFQRLGGVDARYPTQTRIVATAEDMMVRIGDPVMLSAEVSGVLPEGGLLFVRQGDALQWKELPMKRVGESARYERELKDLSGNLTYYIRVGDDHSEEHQVRVIDAPEITGVEMQLVYPAYINRPDGKSDQLDLEVPEGTKIVWNLNCFPTVERLQVKAGEEWIDADVAQGGTNVSFHLTADQPFNYTFRWTEQESGRSFEFDDVQYRVRVSADKPPEVELLRPQSNGLATMKKKLTLVARASDDHGLSSAWLVYSLNGGEERRVLLQELNGSRVGRVKYVWEMKKGIEGLESDAQVTFAVEVSDRYPGGGDDHVRRSATRQVTFVDPERYLDWYRSELAAQNQDVKRARAVERTSLGKVREIKIQEGDSE